MMLVGLSLILLFAAGFGSVALLAYRAIAPEPEAPQPRAVRRPPQRRSPAQRRAEKELIRAGLNAGIPPLMIASLLRGNPAYKRRIVSGVVLQMAEERHVNAPRTPAFA